ncbi:tuliposide A-converting enzyme 2 [Carex littledalei]|uniref:Tuliposide A-converting enzyme 2 n=1 Tax=Carex littledalei TaxID=544730 RepID=A0A833QIA4_9POAL|nr:tuliposide A-converting enzyme 2 [Carex littledalei]
MAMAVVLTRGWLIMLILAVCSWQVAGCSAGGLLRAGFDGLKPGVVVKGMVLILIFRAKSGSSLRWSFLTHNGQKNVEVWHFVYPGTSGLDDPISNPFVEGAPSVKNLVCKRVLVCVAEHDFLRDRGVWYCDKLKESEWDGGAELFELIGEGHGFHVMKPTCEKNAELQERVIAFLKE